MKLTTASICLSFFSLIAIIYTLNSLRRDNLGIRSALVWFALWTGIGFFSLFPYLLNHIMHIAQMEDRMLFILIMAVFILFALLFKLGARMDKMQRTSARLVQEISILTHKTESKNDDKNIRE
jgi:small membrane protein